MKRWLAALIVSLLALGSLTAYAAPPDTPPGQAKKLKAGEPGPYVVHGVTTKEQRTEIVGTGAAIDQVGADFVVITATPEEVQQLAGLGFTAEVLAITLDFPPADSLYHNYSEMVAVINSYVASYPSIVQKFSVGKSYQNRDLWAVKISDNVAVDENEPEVLYIGQYHAREHLTVEQAIYTLKLLADGYGSDSRITNIVNGREIFILFSTNPDGSEYDVATGAYRSWRKNRQPNSGSTYVGTDLNRNHGYRWGCCGGSSGTFSSETYRGASSNSAPETTRVRDFINSRVIGGVQQIKALITFHTYSELVLWPYGYTFTDVPDDMTLDDWNVFKTMGQYMAGTNGYTAQQASDLYITDGDLTDWAYGIHKIFAFTFEMYPTTSTPGFYPADEQIAPQTARNRESILYLAEKANCPYSVIGKACGTAPATLFYDDFETNTGWTFNAGGTDTATAGKWEIGNPGATNSGGAKQLDSVISDMKALVTGALPGAAAGDYDLDGGVTTARSPAIALPASGALKLSFRYNLAYGSNATSADYLRVRVIGASTQLVFEKLAAAANANGLYKAVSVDISSFAGQTVRIQFEAADSGTASLVEAAVDDVRVISQ